MNVKKHLGWIIAGAVVLILLLWSVSGYNGLVSMDEQVAGKWANVETQYQRRADLIPNLVNTVKGYATHEKTTLENVVKARSEATQVKVNPEDLTPERLAEFQKAQGNVSAALGRLLTGASLMGSMLKGEQDTITLNIRADGPCSPLTAVSDSRGFVRGYAGKERVDLPLNGKGKLDVSGAVGKNGTLTVVKDLGLREPYVGQVPLVSGEIAEDITGQATRAGQAHLEGLLAGLAGTERTGAGSPSHTRYIHTSSIFIMERTRSTPSKGFPLSSKIVP